MLAFKKKTMEGTSVLNLRVMPPRKVSRGQQGKDDLERKSMRLPVALPEKAYGGAGTAAQS